MMNQHFTPILLLMTSLTLALQSCQLAPDCYELTGRWSNREGQDLIFEAGGSALWLTRFGSQYDTMRFRYALDCKQAPPALDLSDFDGGPHQGKLLYAILEWQSDTSFRMRYEPGARPEMRPKAFDPEQTVKFYRVQ